VGFRTRAIVIAVAALSAAALQPASASTEHARRVRAAEWRPHMHLAESYASHRRGIIAFAVRTPKRSWGWRARKVFPSASLLKPMLLAAYLGRRSVRGRSLRHAERALLGPMIRRSDNDDAGRVLGIVGAGGLRRVARRAGMRRFAPVTPVWGLSRVDASDQTRFFLHIGRLLPARHRRYGMHLLASIVARQRWGIGRVSPPGWRLYFKGGWGSGTGWVDHQTALLARGHKRVAVAILTHLDGSHSYGKQTLQGIASRLLRGLAVRRRD
jgi:hypothetical protein